MFDQPNAAELIAAARAHLEGQVIPTLTDARLRFQTLVAAHVLAVVERELALGEEALAAAYTRLAALDGAPADPPAGPALAVAFEARSRALCARIRAGAFDEGPQRDALLAHLRQTAIDELRVANPKFLAGKG
ncbi:MAG TPA: DUF6285 domain-containing protein [Roseiflexaceae bacterium]|nr:DUF6285 domain-containing protein [Roseiflexaceae bacterium]